jgi:hypothetical protein
VKGDKLKHRASKALYRELVMKKANVIRAVDGNRKGTNKERENKQQKNEE